MWENSAKRTYASNSTRIMSICICLRTLSYAVGPREKKIPEITVTDPQIDEILAFWQFVGESWCKLELLLHQGKCGQALWKFQTAKRFELSFHLSPTFCAGWWWSEGYRHQGDDCGVQVVLLSQGALQDPDLLPLWVTLNTPDIEDHRTTVRTTRTKN